MNNKKIIYTIILGLVIFLIINIPSLNDKYTDAKIQNFNGEYSKLLNVNIEISNELNNMHKSNSQDYKRLLELQNKLNNIQFDKNNSSIFIDFNELTNYEENVKNTENNILNLEMSKSANNQSFTTKYNSLLENKRTLNLNLREMYIALLKSKNYSVTEKDDGSFRFTKNITTHYFFII